MAYFSLNAYDADIHLSQFAGLMQYGDGMNGDIRYAVEEENVETPAGVLQPQAAPVVLPFGFEGSKIETLANMYRRWYTGNDDREVLFAATAGKLYYKTSSMDDWTQLEFPTGVTAYQCNVWSWVNYEINPVGSTAPVDVLILSNAEDGMIMVRGDTFAVSKITTPKKFGVIERFAERIWGGAIPDDPDMLVYSRPYDPTDWTAAGTTEEPEDGAGDIQQPSWDGDSFTALRQLGQQLIAFKKHRVWRVMGTDPGEYTFKEQYGGGAPFFNTIAVDTERILMADKDGLNVYDGLSVTPWRRQDTEKLWRTVNRDAMEQMCGVLFKQRYYLAFPTGESAVNNELLIYNLEDGTVLHYTGISIESFLATEEKLYATSSTIPGKVMEIHWDSWVTGSASGAAAKWVTPWMTLGNLDVQKGGFDVYFTPEVQDAPVTLTFSIQTEKKIKTKRYTVQPLTAIERSNGRNHRQKRLHFGGTGRRFRLIIEAQTANPWRLIGGLKMIAETDPD
jgi:hypothetical protein